jgi:HEAT repeat protein
MFTCTFLRNSTTAAMTAFLCLSLGACEAESPPATTAPPADEASGPLARTVERLVEKLRADPEDETSQAGLIALRESALPGVVALMSAQIPEIRLAGIAIAREIPGTASLEILIVALDDANEDVRLVAVEALGERGESEATPALLHRYPSEDDNQVRYEILTSLGTIGDPRAIPTLHAGLGDSDRYIRMWSMDALCTMKVPDAPTRALALLDDPETYVRQQVLLSCKRALGHSDASTRLVQIAIEADSLEEVGRARNILRAQATSGSGDRMKTEILEQAIPALNGENATAAGLLLAELGDRRAVPALIEATRDPNPMIRHNSAHLLGLLADPRGVPPLTALLNDDSEMVSATAYDALLVFVDQGDPDAAQATESYTGKKFPERLKNF